MVIAIPKTNPLSPRETEVVDLLCEGISTKEIASILFISKRTVEKHIENIKIKMGYQNRYQLIQHTMRSPL
jgi:DNA-binding CsgD family transcriptional regulator